MTRFICLFLNLLLCGLLMGNSLDEAIAIKSWLDTPFSAGNLEAERDGKMKEWQGLVKGEFETNAMFEQRKAEAAARVDSIQKEYAQKIIDARRAYENHLAKLNLKLGQIISNSRETVGMAGTLGAYDADRQTFTVSIPGKSFQIVVPLDKAPQVKSSVASFGLKVSRQLNADLEWDYLEAALVGSLGTFSSTDKAPVPGLTSAATSLDPPSLTASVSFSEASGNKMLDAEETAEVRIEIKNTGKGYAGQVEASFELLGAQGVSLSPNIYFGEIKAGETVSKTLQLVAGMDTLDKQAELKIRFREQNGFPPDDKVLRFSTLALLAPELYVSDLGIDDFSGNLKIEPGEQVEIKARIHNRGRGLARNVSAELIPGKDVFLTNNSPTTFSLGDMPPGSYRDVVFTIVTAKISSALDLKLSLTEQRSQYSKPAQPLNLAFNRVERTADQLLVTGIQNTGPIASAPQLSIDVEQDIPTRGKTDKNRWGVIFGIEDYKNVPPVRYARRDAETIRDYFISVLGIPAANLYMKTNDDAGLSEFKTIFDKNGWLSKNAGSKDSEIFIYFSGHGIPAPDGKQAYLLPYDGNPDYAPSTAYELEQLYDNLGAIKAKAVTLFLDSCFSGANRDNEIILADARPVFLASPPKVRYPQLAVFSAASSSQVSSAWAEKQHGLFSYYLMKGLRGEADADSDKRVTQAELSNYLYTEVSSQARRMGREKEPGLQSSDFNKVIVQW